MPDPTNLRELELILVRLETPSAKSLPDLPSLLRDLDQRVMGLGPLAADPLPDAILRRVGNVAAEAIRSFAVPDAAVWGSVILGERFQDARALSMLAALRDLPDPDRRDWVAHALQHIAVESPDTKARERAKDLLSVMRETETGLMREQLDFYLERVRRGIAF